MRELENAIERADGSGHLTDIESARTAFEEVDPRLVGLARTLGCGPVAAFFRVSLPLAWRGVVAGTVLAGVLGPAVATGFLVRNYFRWNYNQWMRDNVEHVSKAFLGLTMNCAQCHDHKYDPIPQEDYFRMRAIFEPLEIQQVRISGEADPGPYPKYSFPPGNALKPMASGMVRVFDEKPEALTRMYARGDERAIIEGKAPLGPGIPAILGPVGFKVARVTLPQEVAQPGLRPFVRDEETAKCSAAI